MDRFQKHKEEISSALEVERQRLSVTPGLSSQNLPPTVDASAVFRIREQFVSVLQKFGIRVEITQLSFLSDFAETLRNLSKHVSETDIGLEEKHRILNSIERTLSQVSDRLSELGASLVEEIVKPHDSTPELPPLKVFLCHASTDKPAIRGLCTQLLSQGFDAWLDESKLLPGQDWDLEIRKALKSADAVIVCLSPNAITKDGYVQKELRQALDVAREKPEGTIYVIPARLKECKVPESLRQWHWVDLFEADGLDKLFAALRRRHRGIPSGS